MTAIRKPRAENGRFVTDVANDAPARAFCEWFGITVQAADLLLILHELKGASITALKIKERLNTTFSCVYFQIHRLKAAMECEAIDFGLGGYSLTEIGMAECDGALAEMLVIAA